MLQNAKERSEIANGCMSKRRELEMIQIKSSRISVNLQRRTADIVELLKSISSKFENESKEKSSIKQQRASQRTIAGERSEVLQRLAKAFVLPREPTETKSTRDRRLNCKSKKSKQQDDFARLPKFNVRRVRLLRAANKKKVKKPIRHSTSVLCGPRLCKQQ